MSTAYRCRNEQRRDWVAQIETGSKFRLNGIDYLEVDPESQTKLTLHFINRLTDVAGYSPLVRDNFALSGGVRIREIRVIDPVVIGSDAIVLAVDRPGDFSTYKLRIVEGKGSEKPPAWVDPILSEIEFSFKINCASDFDCRPAEPPSPLQIDEPPIDYMAKDYASFRRLMLDRMGLLMPDWKERNPADIAVAVVELLAYAGDRLSYKQDAVATEAYLNTARKRVSLRRHARLLDYTVFDGCNARVWVQVQVDNRGDGKIITGPDEESDLPGTAFLTRTGREGPVLTLTGAKLENALRNGARLFEAMHSLPLYEAHNEMTFYAWGDEGCFLPKGSTRAYLKDNVEGRRLLLRPGDVLILEEKRSPETGLAADADPARRHAIRLVCVRPEANVDEAGTRTPGLLVSDPLFPDQAVVEIGWHEEDALPFDLCIHSAADPDNPAQDWPVSVASGNIILADHGQSLAETIAVTADKRFRPPLAYNPVARQGHVPPGKKGRGLELFDREGSAASAMIWTPDSVRPAIRLREEASPDLVWQCRPDLLGSDAFSRDFVVESEEDGRVNLRFGDGIMGQEPDYDGSFNVRYRTGNGSDGNVGAETISHMVLKSDAAVAIECDWTGVKKIRNPLAAAGGMNPESSAQIRTYAPQAFKTQQRAVNAPDYAEIAMRHPGIERAAAVVRWTGSWYTVFVTIDRRGGEPVDEAFITEMKTYLDCYRMAGYDIEVNGPLFVPLDIACAVCVKPGYFATDVKKSLLDAFSSRELDGGGRGFFHPDRFTFGQAVYLSGMYATAMAVEGVAFVDVTKFQRLGRKAAGELAAGKLSVGRLEIVRLDNDPNYPEMGKIEFTMREVNV